MTFISPSKIVRSYPDYLKRLRESLGTSVERLDFIGSIQANGKNYPIPKLVFGKGNPGRILISAGIHGDEPAGVETLLAFLKEKRFQKYPNELTLLPCLNPTGYELGTRNNHADKDLNREFKLNAPSPEVSLIRNEFKNPFDLTLELHEDVDSHGYYLYQKEKSATIGDLGRKILSRVETVMPVNMDSEIDGMEANQGVLSRLSDPGEMDWWPMALFSYSRKTRICFTLETSVKFPMATRVNAHLSALDAAITGFHDKEEAD